MMLGRTWKSVASAAALLLVMAGLTGLPLQPAYAVACSGVAGDVNGDGHAELAVGSPGNADASGAVHVFYGQADGLAVDATGTALNDQYFTQDTPGRPRHRRDR